MADELKWRIPSGGMLGGIDMHQAMFDLKHPVSHSRDPDTSKAAERSITDSGEIVSITRASKPIIKFIEEIEKSKNGCWNWRGSLNEKGYGQIWDGIKNVRAHRWSYEYFREPIADGLVVDHMCRNRACVNPWHLRTVSPKVNALENSFGQSAINSRKTHCKRGHEFTQENTIFYKNGVRTCKECARACHREAYIRRKSLKIKPREKRK